MTEGGLSEGKEQLRQGSGEQVYKELMRVQHSIRSVLEWERMMMRDHVGRATKKVQEWVVKEQRG